MSDVNDGIYAAPVANLENEPVTILNNPFYVVSEKKFLALFIATFGIYSFFWFFRNWSNYRHVTGEKLWPVARSIFSIFFIHSLFKHVKEKLDQDGKTIAWNHESGASLLVCLIIIQNVCSRLTSRTSGVTLLDYATICLMFPIIFFMLKAQRAINLACDDPKGDTNCNFSALNFVFIGLGVIWWMLVLFGMFVPE